MHMAVAPLECWEHLEKSRLVCCLTLEALEALHLPREPVCRLLNTSQLYDNYGRFCATVHQLPRSTLLCSTLEMMQKTNDTASRFKELWNLGTTMSITTQNQ